MNELSKKDREILVMISNGAPDHQVCRQFGMLPAQLKQVLIRVARRAEEYDEADNAALFYERALRRRAENHILSLEARFNALMEGSPEAVLVVNAMTGAIQQVNDNASKLFGFSRERLIGRSVEDLVPERYRKIHPAYRVGFLSSVRKREMGYHPPIFAQREDGSEIEIAISLTASLADDDVMVVCSDYARWKMHAPPSSEFAQEIER